jgi:hypothetical protein
MGRSASLPVKMVPRAEIDYATLYRLSYPGVAGGDP